MDSKKQLVSSCNEGLCSCGDTKPTECNVNVADDEITEKPLEPAWRLQWWLEHSQKQTAKLWELIGEHLDEATQSDILEQLGRNCAENYGKAQQYIGNPDGFFEFMKEHSGEVIHYDKEAGIITVTTRERDCDCRLVNSKNISHIYCNCSRGWQKYTYETILGKKVNADVTEAVIRGSNRCGFKITILDERID